MKYPNFIKLIFLDLDGVMNSNDFYVSRGTKTQSQDVEEFYLNMIDPSAVDLLNTLVQECDCKVVISSTWRDSAIEHNVLKRKGFIGEVIGRTPLYTEMPKQSYETTHMRGYEIRQWIEDNIEHPSIYKSYVIFDDDMDMLESQKQNFIHIDFMKGLQTENIQEAITILTEQDDE
jgi:histidinol phosphatase-like enzyme